MTSRIARAAAACSLVLLLSAFNMTVQITTHLNGKGGGTLGLRMALDKSGLPSASQRSLPDPTSACELCGDRPKAPLSTVLAIDGPDGLPVPFLICQHCRRALDALHSLLESAGGALG